MLVTLPNHKETFDSKLKDTDVYREENLKFGNTEYGTWWGMYDEYPDIIIAINLYEYKFDELATIGNYNSAAQIESIHADSATSATTSAATLHLHLAEIALNVAFAKELKERYQKCN